MSVVGFKRKDSMKCIKIQSLFRSPSCSTRLQKTVKAVILDNLRLFDHNTNQASTISIMISIEHARPVRQLKICKSPPVQTAVY